MKQFVDWEYYSSLYDKVKKDDFEKAEMLAEQEVSMVVGAIHYAQIDDTEPCIDQLKDCICKVIDKMAENNKSGAGKGISSVSNDGYSESYVIQTKEQETADLHRCIRTWLSGTGIVRAY